MKNVYKAILTLLLGSSSVIFAQENVGIGTKSPDNSAVLDIQAVDKGLLIPRLTIEQRNNIATPANGLMVYQTNDKSGFYYYDGNLWKPMSGEDAKSVMLDPDDWSATSLLSAAAVGDKKIGLSSNLPFEIRTNNQISGWVDPRTTFQNSYFGYQAGNGNTNSGLGKYNSALGYKALFTNTNGQFNLAVGWNALYANTIGSGNMAIGAAALANNTDGGSNVAIGNNAMGNNTTGNGSIAIGANSGFQKNGSNNIYIGLNAGRVAALTAETNTLYINSSNAAVPNPLIKGSFTSNWVKINSKTAGYLAVGDWDAVSPMPTPTGYRLIVQDGILTEKVKVALKTTGDWADYVFDDDYKKNMMSLEDIEKFTTINKHLPNVPSAQSMKENGLDVSQTSKMFMEKIEELTLYLIELNKEVKALKVENNVLKEKK